MADTPLQKLGSAIEDFLRETSQLDQGAFMTGWVMAAATARIQTDDETSLPMVTGATYSIGPETSVVQASGLNTYLGVVLEKAMWTMTEDDPDD